MTSTVKSETPPAPLDPPPPIMQTRRLPQELTGLVMNNLLYDTPSLSSASLVCKSWSEESSRILFREVMLRDPSGREADLLALVKDSERVRKSIRSLSLGSLDEDQVSVYFPTISFDTLLRILVCLPKLHALRIFSLRLERETEVPDCLSQFRSMKLSFTQLVFWNVPYCMQSARSYMLLLSSVREVRTLYISSRTADWPPYKAVSEDYFKDAVPSSPLRVKNFEIEFRTISPYLEWLCNLRGTAIDIDNIKMLTALIQPLHTYQHYSISAIPNVLKFMGSFRALKDLNLNIPISQWAIFKEPGMSLSSHLPDLSSFHSLENLNIRRIFACNHMDLIPSRHRNAVRRAWEMLVDMFWTAPSSLRTIEFLIEQDLVLHDVDEWAKPDLLLMDSFLHDGSPESVERQVYDWGLLGKLAAERKNIKHIAFGAFPNCDPLVDEDWLQYKPPLAATNNAWDRYPNSVRVLKAALPGITEFKTV